MDRTSPSGFVALALLSALAFFTSGSGVNAVPEHKQTASRRELQTTSNIVFVESIAGLAIATAQEDAMGLQIAEGATPTSTNSIQVETVSSNAEYDMYFSLASTPAGTTDFTVSFSAQLSDGAQWKVDLYDFGPVDDWSLIGDLSGVATSGWTSKDIIVSQASGSSFIEAASSEILLRVYATGTQTGYIDYVSIVAGATAPPVTPPPVVTPTALPVTPQPVVVPTPGSTGTASVAEFVAIIKGAAILATQEGGVPLTTADNAAITDTTTSIEFTTAANGDADIEIYLSAPSLPTGANGLEITFVYQLGIGADLSNWKVDMYEHVGSDDFVVAGDLPVGTGTTWKTAKVTLATMNPSNFIDPTAQEVMVRLYTSGATGLQTIYLDYISVVATGTTASTTCGTTYACPAGFTLDPAATCAGTTCVDAECCTQSTSTCGVAYICPAGFALDPAATCAAATCLDTECCTQSTCGAAYTCPAGFILDPTAPCAAATCVDTECCTQPICGAAYTCPVGFLLDPAATCASATCVDTECCTQLTCASHVCPASFDLNPASTCTDTCDTAQCCTEVFPAEVLVDMQPCILAKEEIVKDVGLVADAYLFNIFFKGFWTASQNLQAPAGEVLDLTNDVSHGKCNAILVAIVPTAAQKLQLESYSRRFKVRVVYFDSAETANDPTTVNRLGFQQSFGSAIEGAPKAKFTTAGGSPTSVVSPTLVTDFTEFNIFRRPMAQFSTGDGTGVSTAVAEYADASGAGLADISNNPSAAIVTWIGTDGIEEMHVFFSLAWFDMNSWAWAHYITEWATKGIFQGERRFSLGGVVDDHFLSTGVFDFSAPDQTGPPERLTGAQLGIMAAAQDSFNTQYKASVFTDFAFNGLGILDKVDSQYRAAGPFADIALLPKGQKPTPPEGIVPQLPVNWLAISVAGMEAEFQSWRAKDDLLDATLSDEILSKFHWQSHTYSHLARDNLGQSDCNIEDAGNARIAVITGMFDSNNYNWRSMTSPGITGLFNPNCLSSGAANLMKCYPGDNTYDGVQTPVSLVSQNSQFHGIYTTEATNGYAGSQIIPRFATNVYYNCVTTDCLIKENEKIRRDVCGCTPLDPDQAITSCTSCPVNNIGSFGTVDNLFATEQVTTTRYILSGRRDKYMFHQANVIPTTTPTGQKSLLEYWYEVVFAKLAEFINTDSFPITTLKFDDLCQNFAEHENLDNSNVLLTATVEYATGAILDMTLFSTDDAGLIPITVPTASAASISLGSLVPHNIQVYGSDTTYYIATSASAIPPILTKPDVSELAPVPAPVSVAENAADEAIQEAETEAAAPELEEQGEVAEEAAAQDEAIQNENGFTNEIMAKVTPEDETVAATP